MAWCTACIIPVFRTMCHSCQPHSSNSALNSTLRAAGWSGCPVATAFLVHSAIRPTHTITYSPTNTCVQTAHMTQAVARPSSTEVSRGSGGLPRD